MPRCLQRIASTWRVLQQGNSCWILVTQSRGRQWTPMTKTQNTNSNSPQNRPAHTNSSSRSHQAGAGTTNSGAKRNSHQRWQGKKRFGSQKKTTSLVTPIGPVKVYISACCQAPARKPKCGTKVAMQDPETKRTKDKPLGLGKWRCTSCGLVTKVTPRKPSDVAPAAVAVPEVALAAAAA